MLTRHEAPADGSAMAPLRPPGSTTPAFTASAASSIAPAATAAVRADAVATLLDALTSAMHAVGSRWTDADTARVQAFEQQLLAHGEMAAPGVIERLDARGVDPAVRSFLFHVLRQLPGYAAHARVVAEARTGRNPDLHTMAIEALGTTTSVADHETLAMIARSHPELPAQPSYERSREPSSADTELPHDVVMTPRIRAVVALGARGDARAVAQLADLARTGADAAVRTEAARQLRPRAATPQIQRALLAAATSDGSAYVRLAAIDALTGQTSPQVKTMLRAIARTDGDPGVRARAAEVLGDDP